MVVHLRAHGACVIVKGREIVIGRHSVLIEITRGAANTLNRLAEGEAFTDNRSIVLLHSHIVRLL